MDKLTFVLAMAAAAPAAWGAQIILPATSFERDAPVHAVFKTERLATGTGQLQIDWTDVDGRLVDTRTIPVDLDDETDVGFVLDLRRAIAMQNELRAHFTFDGMDKKGAKDHRDETATVAFVAKPPVHRWWDYNIIMWQQHSPEMFRVLKTLGIDGGEYGGRSATPPEFFLQNDLRWYAENIATDFYSAYHHYYPDRNNGWEYRAAKLLYEKDPSSLEPFKRHPSLTDAAWLQKVHDRLVESARRFSPYRPFFYSLGDETGIAELAAFWDFDFSDQSLVPMREWLKQRYGTLAALNRQWGSNFTNWNLVIPMTTNQAMKRADDNFSSWGDFKEWMDICYANALKMGREAVQSVDPEAYVGIGGGQMPGWGGYDYSRIAKSLNAIEPYDIGNNIEIIRSLNPNMAVVTTGFAHGPWEKHRVWYEFLHGNRGLILWDDKSEFVTKDGQIEERGRESEPYYNELRGGLGALLINSRRLADPIAIHYSQPSMRIEWLLERRPQGDAWVKRFSSNEYRDSNFLRLRESYCRLLEDAGMQYNFVSYGQVEDGELLRGGYRVLILPHSSALSTSEAAAIHDFVAQGGIAVADGNPGAFDAHDRRLPESQLADLFGGAHDTAASSRAFGNGKGVYLNLDVIDYHRNRVVGKGQDALDAIGHILRDAGVRPAFTVTDEQGKSSQGVETHVFQNGGVRIVALLTNPELRIEDLGPPDFKSNERFAHPRTLKLTLPEASYVVDIRRAKALGRTTSVSVELDPYEPSIFAISPEPMPDLRVAAPARIAKGQTGRIGCSFGATTPAAMHVLHIDVDDPSGKPVPHYSGNLLAPHGRAAWTLPIAWNDPAGAWRVRVKDLLTGQARDARIDIY